MFKTNPRNFKIELKGSGRNRWYAAVHTKDCGERIVYTRNNLRSLKSFIKSKGDTFTVTFW